MKKNNDKQFNAYQKGSIVTINRVDIIDDDCNPRIIDEENRKNLKRSIKKYGLVRSSIAQRNE